MAALRKFDVAVTLEAAGFRVTDDGLTFFLNESAETFATAWRQLNSERESILDAFDRAGPDADRQLDAAMDVIHDLLCAVGIEPQERPQSDSVLRTDTVTTADVGNGSTRGPDSSHTPADCLHPTIS